MGDSIYFMRLTNIPDINEKELSTLISVARKSGNYSDPRLGQLVSDIVKKCLASKDFNGYTEDWQLDMFGDGVLAVYEAITNPSITMSNCFNYCYTTAKNKMGKTVGILKKNVPKETLTEIDNDPAYVRNKRRLLRGFFDNDAEKNVLGNVLSRKLRPLKNAVGVSARAFAENFTSNQLESLIGLARSVRNNGSRYHN